MIPVRSALRARQVVQASRWRCRTHPTAPRCRPGPTAPHQWVGHQWVPRSGRSRRGARLPAAGKAYAHGADRRSSPTQTWAPIIASKMPIPVRSCPLAREPAVHAPIEQERQCAKDQSRPKNRSAASPKIQLERARCNRGTCGRGLRQNPVAACITEGAERRHVCQRDQCDLVLTWPSTDTARLRSAVRRPAAAARGTPHRGRLASGLKVKARRGPPVSRVALHDMPGRSRFTACAAQHDLYQSADRSCRHQFALPSAKSMTYRCWPPSGRPPSGRVSYFDGHVSALWLRRRGLAPQSRRVAHLMFRIAGRLWIPAEGRQ